MNVSLIITHIVAYIAILNTLIMLFNKKEMQLVFAALAKNRPVIFIMGMIISSLGISALTIIFMASSTTNWLILAFFIGITCEGLLFTLTQHAFLKKYFATMQNDTTYYSIAASYFFIGLLLLV